MQFDHFIAQYETLASWYTPVMCFTGQSYPALFFSSLSSHYARWGISQSVILDMHIAPDQYRSSLEMLFLGQRCWYFLSARDDVSPTTRTAWTAYLSTYAGPHVIWCFSKDGFSQKTSNVTVITIPEHIDKRIFMQLKVLHGDVPSRAFTDQLYAHDRKISLDTALMMMRYASLAGIKTDDFFESWIAHLVPNEESLFSLSQYFFAKQPEKFFELWSSLSSVYVPQFWLTFWSEQLWRAACYTQAMSSNDTQEARKIGYRLPFLYLKRDWKEYSLSELQRAHHALYRIDFALKNGESDLQIDTFFNAFLHNKFRAQK